MITRRKFAQTCLSCIGAGMGITFAGACASTKYIAGTLENNGISVAPSVFENASGSAARYVIIPNDALQFPIYLYQHAAGRYSAVLMQCTHQGNELQAAGDHLHCAAHGSEFNSSGKMVQGPAERDLRSFPVTQEQDKIFIDLRG